MHKYTSINQKNQLVLTRPNYVDILKDGDNSYQLIFVDGTGQEVFEAHLIKLGGEQFLDWYFAGGGCQEGSADELDGVHTLHRLTLNDDTLRLAYLDDRWLEEKIEEGLEIAHVVEEHYQPIPAIPEMGLDTAHVERYDQLILTATPEELQAMVLLFLGDDDMLEEWLELIRR